MPRLGRLQALGRRQYLGDAEVEDLHLQRAVRLRYQLNVLRLEIAVDNPLRVDGAEGPAHLVGNERHLRRVHRAPSDELAERLALEELHDEVGLAAGRLAEVQDLDDVLVRDHVDGARLVEEAGDDVGIGRQDGVEQLDGDPAPHDRVLGQADHPHRPLPELLDDPVVPDHLVGKGGRSHLGGLMQIHDHFLMTIPAWIRHRRLRPPDGSPCKKGKHRTPRRHHSHGRATTARSRHVLPWKD